jgi:hypothetical protein
MQLFQDYTDNQDIIKIVDCPFCKKCKVWIERSLHFRTNCWHSWDIWCKELKYLLNDVGILLNADIKSLNSICIDTYMRDLLLTND